MRTIQNDDLWAAIRGLSLWSADNDELRLVISEHAESPLFASKVITEAARQVLAVKVVRRVEGA